MDSIPATTPTATATATPPALTIADIDARHNLVDVRTDQPDLLHVFEDAYNGYEIISEKLENESLTHESINTKILLPCQDLKIGNITEGSSPRIEHPEKSTQATPGSSDVLAPHPAPNSGQENVGSDLQCITFGSHQTIDEGYSTLRIEHPETLIPTTPNPSEGFAHLPAANFSQENVGSVLDCNEFGNHQINGESSSLLRIEPGQENVGSVLDRDAFGSHQTIDDFSTLALLNVERDQCDSLAVCSERSIDSQPLPDGVVISGEQQCKRNGTRWRCHEKALPGRIHCEKHQFKRDNYNRLRRKNPERTRFSIDQCSPSTPRQCGRTGKGWRCPKMAILGKLYCERHQPKRDAYNEKRRKKPKEDSGLVLAIDNK